MTNDLEKKVANEEGWNLILCCWFPLPKQLKAEPEATEAKPDTPAYSLAEGYRTEPAYDPNPPATP